MRPEPRAVPGLPGTLPDLELSLLDDRSPRNVVRVAEAFWLAGEPKKSIRLLELLLEERRGTIAARILLGWCYEAAERVAEADRVWAEVARLDPEHPFVKGPQQVDGSPAAGTGDEEQPLVGRTPPPAEVKPLPGAREHLWDPEDEAEPEAELTAADLQHVPPAHLYSATLAEIFERQGFAAKALEIYREIVRRDPERQDLIERIALLEAAGEEESPS